MALTRSELTGEGESTRGLGEKRDLTIDILGLNSWGNLWPNSDRVGWERVSDIGRVWIEEGQVDSGEWVWHVLACQAGMGELQCEGYVLDEVGGRGRQAVGVVVRAAHAVVTYSSSSS